MTTLSLVQQKFIFRWDEMGTHWGIHRLVAQVHALLVISMHTDFTDPKAKHRAGSIYFDGQCRFCVAHRARWGSVFERRGIVWVPLQTPGTAERLGITEAQLQAEMWLQLADGRRCSGINAWSALMRRVWWLWPLGVVLALPGFNAIGRALYREIAKHRHGIGGVGPIPKRT
jgi:predicted DCC family thiol-disulfide oxidoreductase YuxK